MSVDAIYPEARSSTHLLAGRLPGTPLVPGAARVAGAALAVEPVVGASEITSAPELVVHDGHVAVNREATLAGTQSEIADTALVKSSVAADLWQLTKPRIVMMVLVTTVVAAIVASPTGVGLLTLLHLWIGVAMVAGSAGAMNQVWEREIDRHMARTRLRPLPDGRLSARAGLIFASLLGLLGTVYLWQVCGPMPALVGVATWLTYVPIYTPLKRRSSFNTTIGAISGALPVLIGYTAAGGLLTELNGWLLFGVLAAWQYPHFMAIAWLYRSQYASAGFRMTTTVEPTGRAAGVQSVVGMVILIGCLFWLVPAGTEFVGRQWFWIAAIALVSYPMTLAAIRFALCRDDATARKLLRASLLQLPLSLVIVTAAAIIH